ncbi:MAG TPA: hypothetical protein VET23_05645, partial [Chitinophagaceae bacterium]|nr:hypothetical protein [Chitinophagaceae bacterium]
MNLRILFGFFFILSGAISQGKNPSQKFDKSAFYAVMASGIMDDIDKMFTLLNSVSIPEKEAYEGALMMRKSGLLKLVAEKQKFFKKGRIKLETELLKDSSNCEYHFLRLTIQEHAPKVVKYNTELESDKQFIIKCFKSLAADVQKAIFDYSRNSK